MRFCAMKPMPPDLSLCLLSMYIIGLHQPKALAVSLTLASHHHQCRTQREQEVLYLIADKYPSIEIAERLFVSYEAIHTHRKNILTKLGAKNRAGLIKRAFEANLTKTPKSTYSSFIHIICINYD